MQLMMTGSERTTLPCPLDVVASSSDSIYHLKKLIARTTEAGVVERVMAEHTEVVYSQLTDVGLL